MSVLNGKMAAVNSHDVSAGTMHSVFRFCQTSNTLKGHFKTVTKGVKFLNMCAKGRVLTLLGDHPWRS